MGKILVIGSINQDITVHMEKLPMPGETVIASQLKSSLGGKGANQAVTAARMGAEVAFIGAIGKEKSADEILDVLNKDKIDTHGIERLDTPTGSAYISIDETAENNIIVYPGANFKITKEQLLKHEALFQEADYCLLQFEIPMDIIEETINLCKKHKVKVVLNPAPFNTDFEPKLLEDVDFFIPNETEFLQIVGADLNQVYDLEYFKAKGQEFVEEYDLTLIITLGSQGALVIKDEWTLVPAYKTKAVDTTAAGDSFIGSFLAALSTGKNEFEALDFAAKVASKTISRYGAISAIPYKKEIK